MKSRKRSGLVYVISLVDESLAFKWFFHELFERRKDFTVIFMHPAEPGLMHMLESAGIAVRHIPYRGKNDMPAAMLKLMKLLRELRPALVHTHLFDASFAGLTTAWLSGVPLRIHTRHHASQHHDFHPGTVKFDRWINSISTHIIAISGNIRDILVQREGVASGKITVIHHGFQLDHFYAVDVSRVTALRRKYSIPDHAYVVGMISRFTHWKGIQDVIPAFGEFLKRYPDALLVLANARGDYEKELLLQLKNTLPDSSYRVIVFEKDSAALYHLFNVFVHVPVNTHVEAFGQVYIEAMAAGCSSVFTKSGIAADIAVNGDNCMVVPFESPEAVKSAIFELRENPDKARLLAARARVAAEAFSINRMADKTLEVYAG